MNQREGKVLVEEIAQEVAHAEIGPAAVHQEEPLQVPKLSEGVIWGQNSLHPLLTADTHTDVSRWGRNTQCGSLPFEMKNSNHHWIITEIFTILKMTNITLKLADYFHSWFENHTNICNSNVSVNMQQATRHVATWHFDREGDSTL